MSSNDHGDPGSVPAHVAAIGSSWVDKPSDTPRAIVTRSWLLKGSHALTSISGVSLLESAVLLQIVESLDFLLDVVRPIDTFTDLCLVLKMSL